MRNPKALFIPFRFPGYPEALVNGQTEAARNLLQTLGIDLIAAPSIVKDKDADALTEGFAPAGVDFVLALVPTWIEPPLAIRALKPFFDMPMVLWGFTSFRNEGRRVHMGGMAGSGAVHGSLREMGVPHLALYGMPDSVKVRDRITRFANLARTRALLDRSKIGMVGYVFSGMHAGGFDNASLRMTVGPEIEHIDTYSLVRRMEDIKEDSRAFKAGREIINSCLSSETPLEGQELSRVSKMYVALEQLCSERNLNAITLKCHYELSREFGQSACIPLSVLGNRIVASCEADIPVVTTQLIMHYLAGGKLTSYVDIHDLAEGKALVGACGYAPADMCMNEKIRCGKAPAAAGGLGATFSGWIVNSSPLKSGRVTLARLLKQSLGYTMHYATGEALGDVGDVSELDCPPYPTTKIRLDGDMDRFAQNMGSHHYAIIYEDIADELSEFCALMNINIAAG